MKRDPSINPHLYVRSIRNVGNIGFRFKFFIKHLRLITYKGYIKFNLKLPETYLKGTPITPDGITLVVLHRHR